jgi:hypothetical protein
MGLRTASHRQQAASEHRHLYAFHIALPCIHQATENTSDRHAGLALHQPGCILAPVILSRPGIKILFS